MERKTKSVKVGERTLTFETGHMARLANAAVVTRCEETLLLTTVCSAPSAPGTDFVPLRVDYQQRMSSTGKTLGGFIKREGRPTEIETLVCRLIDRPIRPMFEEGFFDEVQILSYVFSYDGIVSPEPLAICGASAALVLSDVPLIKPIGAVRVGMIDGKFIINPTPKEQEISKLDLMLAGTDDAILMIEGYCDFLTEEQVIEAITLGHTNIKAICEALSEWQQEIGKEKNRSRLQKLPSEVFDAVEKIVKPNIGAALRLSEKKKREEAINALKASVHQALLPEGQPPKYEPFYIARALKEVQAKYMREMILTEKIRSDGRSTTEIRPITISQSVLPRTHGSSLFTRGETQALAVCTLGSESMAQRYEDLDGEGAHRFYLQYSFPPFSVGEVGRSGPPGRREVGHGKLAERALSATLPSQETFPYIIRLESNILESNGSSSMASVCGGCLAMMDAGIPIERPVSGIAMGLILEGDRFAILSDILGIEDALGDMDFKITGDQKGITAFQMDIKIEGITPAIMKAALMQAKEGRVHILQKMLEACPSHKTELSIYAPRIETMEIRPSKIGLVIGPGGKQIRAIIEESGATIDIDDSGRVHISAPNIESIEKARSMINSLTAEVEVGRVYTGYITSVVKFGVFVEILPGKEGLCHISEFDNMRINNMEDFAKKGDKISVKVLDVNEHGQVKLSRRMTLS